MNTTVDAKALKVLKLCAAAKSPGDLNTAKVQLNELRGFGEEQENALRSIGTYFLTRERMLEIGQPIPAPVELLLFLATNGAPKTAEFGLSLCAEALANLPVEQVARTLSSSALEALATKRKSLLNELVDWFSAADVVDLQKAAALEWVVRKAKAQDLSKLVPRILDLKDRTVGLATPEALVTSILEKDKSGRVYAHCAERAATSAELRQVLLRALVKSSAFRGAFLQRLPREKGASAELSAELFRDWISTLNTEALPARDALMIIGIVGKLLATKKPATAQSVILNAISQHGARVIRGKGAGWIVLDASEMAMPASSSARITDEGATLFLATYDRIPAEQPTKEQMKSLAFNLGLRPVGAVGDSVIFSADQHEDTSGGLLPGDSATIIEGGWELNGRYVGKIKVKGNNG